jgi:hypothetical protein
MNKIFACSLCILSFLSCNEIKNKQEQKPLQDSVVIANPYIKQDQSEMDMSWWPANYPMQKMQGDTSQKLMARLIYSRPFKKGRAIFGETEASLCTYGKPWRLGANECTEITFFEDVLIDNKKINKGSYVLYCIPQKDNWTLIFNSDLYTWGLHINSNKDLFKIKLPTAIQEPSIENFTMIFEDSKLGANLIMAWDNVKVSMPIEYAK